MLAIKALDSEISTFERLSNHEKVPVLVSSCSYPSQRHMLLSSCSYPPQKYVLCFFLQLSLPEAHACFFLQLSLPEAHASFFLQLSFPEACACFFLQLFLPEAHACFFLQLSLPEAHASFFLQLSLPEAHASFFLQLSLPETCACFFLQLSLPETRACFFPQLSLPEAHACFFLQLSLPEAHASFFLQLSLSEVCACFFQKLHNSMSLSLTDLTIIFYPHDSENIKEPLYANACCLYIHILRKAVAKNQVTSVRICQSNTIHICWLLQGFLLGSSLISSIIIYLQLLLDHHKFPSLHQQKVALHSYQHARGGASSKQWANYIYILHEYCDHLHWVEFILLYYLNGMLTPS